jgi:NDP-sugar pyrophosphorylase family protein
VEGVNTVLIGAIVVLGESYSTGLNPVGSRIHGTARLEHLAITPIASLEILGMSALQRTIQSLQRAGVEKVSVVAEASACHMASQMGDSAQMFPVHHSSEVWLAAKHVFGDYVKNGVETVLLARLGAYIEFDLVDLIQFHWDKRQPSTQIVDREGPLDFWVLDIAACAKAGIDFDEVMGADSSTCITSYSRASYVNRLSDAFCLRRFVVDAFLARCSAKPPGKEAKPGVWIDQSAQVDRRARIVAPAYIGPRARIRASGLITRFSNIERGCEVDSGTAVDDSSILGNTYLGTWLDVSHAVVYGSNFAHLHHNRTIEIRDPRLIGKTTLDIRPRSMIGTRSP